MSNNKLQISYCFGVYNEENVLKGTIKKLKTKLEKICGKDNYEILIVENGSSDNTPQILKQLKLKNVTSIILKEKGHGLALRTAIRKAKYNKVVLTGVDLPFGFSDLDKAIEVWDKYDILFGSKAHADSIFPTTLQRKYTSKIFSLLLRLLFKLSIKDPQGSVFLKRTKILQVLKHCDANNGFFTSQLAIYAHKYNLQFKEIPVHYVRNTEGRKSKYKIHTDGAKMLVSLLREYRKVNTK